ncbi:MAG: ribosome recycling factor [Pseudomonadales bacterium]|nr:ribosome recycling factor [Pseudomonadales bacterium]MCP5331122.1 ribosome recycling factor [Pseudomonadales bacterium]MCP5343585.1 ribosome recycling factor [Pseudomonadales bacterium]
MIEDFIKDAEQRMAKSIVSLEAAFNKIRTGRAHPSLLDTVMVSYYGADTPLNQLANITVEDARCLVVVPWEKPLIGEVEKAIMKSDLGLNPSNNGETIRVPMPALTEETRREYTRQAKAEAENARVAIRNIRRDANGSIKDLLKEKEISEDDQRRAEERIQKITDKYIASVDAHYGAKETDLLSI